jgi:hypothetical protein
METAQKRCNPTAQSSELEPKWECRDSGCVFVERLLFVLKRRLASKCTAVLSSCFVESNGSNQKKIPAACRDSFEEDPA